MSHNSCHHSCDWTDEPEVDDAGCCVPMPFRRDCEAPVIPTPECDEEPPVMAYDPETEGFSLTSILYDENCSPILDQNSDAITTLIA